jgi:hypothetical protein
LEQRRPSLWGEEFSQWGEEFAILFIWTFVYHRLFFHFSITRSFGSTTLSFNIKIYSLLQKIKEEKQR